jgi:imidazolonepropionase-like amidohydrolase
MFGAVPDFADLAARSVLMTALSGWEPLEVIEAMTGTAGRACGLLGKLGVIAPGSTADLVALAADPLRDPAALFAVELVVRQGAMVATARPAHRVPA